MTTKTMLDQSASWNRDTNENDFSTDGLDDAPPLAAPVTLNDAQTLSPAVSPGLTYYVRFTTANGSTGPLDGSTLYQLNSFSFDDQQTLNIGSQSSGAGAGKVTFNPLDLVLTQPALTPALFEMLASGATFKEVDVLGYGQDGTLATDDSFGLVAASDLAERQQRHDDGGAAIRIGIVHQHAARQWNADLGFMGPDYQHERFFHRRGDRSATACRAGDAE